MPSHPGVEDGTVDEAIVAAVRDQTHVLLGRTIGFSEEEWASPSRLPGWTRSHVAAHLVRNAQELTARARGELDQHDVGTPDERAHELELASLAGGLDLQIALDTSAGELDEALAASPPDRDVALTRLYEVVLHTFDMNPHDDSIHLDPEVANHLLAFHIEHWPDQDLPRLLVVSHEGLEAQLGPEGEPLRVTGPAADLLAWLARGVITDRVGGAVELPPIH